MKTTGLLLSTPALLLGLSSVVTGCNTLLPTDLLDALPSDEAVTLRVPGGSSSALPGVFQPLVGSTSEYHSQVVQISTLVNANVVELVRRVRSIAAYPPSKQEGDTSTWGPYSPGGLDALTYRFTAKKTAPATYDISLDARPSSSASEGDYKVLLDGNVVGILGGQGGKGRGEFTVHLDNRAALDANWLAKGELRIVYDASGDPRKIDVDLHGFDETSVAGDETAPAPADATYRYTEGADKSGSFLLVLHLNVQDGSLPGAETVTLQSRWAAGGAGRGDATITGDDVATQLSAAGIPGQVIHATECWDASFDVVFQDTSPEQLRNVVRPLQGDPAQCAFTEADYPAAP